MDDPILEELSGVFRRYGFAGASIGSLAQACGLARASLYHRFPDGKAQMAAEVARRWARRFDAEAGVPLRESPDRESAVAGVLRGLRKLYDGGKLPCLFEALTRGEPRVEAHRIAEEALRGYQESLKAFLARQGVSAGEAGRRAGAIVRAVAGGVAVGRILDDTAAFDACLAEVEELLLA